MSTSGYQTRQLTEELSMPESGKQSLVLTDDATKKVILFAMAAGGGLPEHIAPLPAVILVLSGHAEITVADWKVEGKPGTWIQMEAKTPHAILATTPVRMVLTLFKA